jgi:uncharacterized membrane protein YjjB (DUF3815 family)
MEDERQIWNDIGNNIKNLFKIIFRILFVRFFWVGLGSTILFLLMIPAMRGGDLSIFAALIASIAGGFLGHFLSKR